MDNPLSSTQIKHLFVSFYLFTFESPFLPFYFFTFRPPLSPQKEIFHFSFFTVPLKGVSPFFTFLPFYL